MALRPLVFLLLSGFGISGAAANVVGCGGNSFSYAEVVPDQRPRQPGPIVVMPDSLCAELIEHRRPGLQSLDIVIDPRSGAARGMRASPGAELPDAPTGRAGPRRGMHPHGW